jgi:hypothetical protein
MNFNVHFTKRNLDFSLSTGGVEGGASQFQRVFRCRGRRPQLGDIGRNARMHGGVGRPNFYWKSRAEHDGPRRLSRG